MPSKRTHVISLVALLASSSSACGAELPRGTGREVQALAEAAVARLGMPGLSVAVVHKGEVAYARGLGMADRELSNPARPSTVYRIASVSKPITAVAVLQLAERGRLDLDAPVQRYCRAYAEKAWPVSARQLLGHLGGLRDRPPANPGRNFTVAESVALLEAVPLESEPGTKYLYSSSGYTLLACAIEGASGQGYLDFLRGSVFEPAGMTRTGDPLAIQRDRAATYDRAPRGAPQRTAPPDTQYKLAGAGLVSTAEDLARFAIALLGDRLLRRETRQAMWGTQRTTDGRATGYGLGWAIVERDGVEEAFHVGGLPGVSSVLYVIPAESTAVALLANLGGVQGELRLIARQMADAVRRE